MFPEGLYSSWLKQWYLIRYQILVRALKKKLRKEESTNKIICETRDLLENIVTLKEDLKHVYLEALDSSQLCFFKSDRQLFMNLLLKNLNSNAYSVDITKEEIGLVKEDLEYIRSFFENIEQKIV